MLEKQSPKNILLMMMYQFPRPHDTHELPLRSTLETSYWEGGRLIDAENVRLNPHVQWSIGAGIGLQYDFTPAIGLFAEPSLQYYFHNSDAINTWRTNHTFTPLLPFGLRISF